LVGIVERGDSDGHWADAACRNESKPKKNQDGIAASTGESQEMSKATTGTKNEERKHNMLPFSEFLENRAQDSSLPKRHRTRNRFKAGAARILETGGYHGLQLSSVCKEVGLSQGSIYNYFDDKKELALEVMTEFADRMFAILLNVNPTGDTFSRIYQVNLAYVRFVEKNVGLVRCLSQLCDEMREFTDLWHRQNYGWCLLVARNLQNRTGSQNWGAALALARALGSMVDEVLHEVYIRQSNDFSEVGGSPEALAETLSIFWYRMAFASNPKSEALSDEHPLLEISLDRSDRPSSR